MAGLSDALTNKETVETTLPSWYTSAQQKVVTDLGTAAQPTFATTTGGAQATKAFGPDTGFGKAASTLESIASGAANPWKVTTDATGAQTVAPDVSTALGGLFKSQTDYLSSILPDIAAAPAARGISGGGFGSSMNQAAIERVKSQAINDLFQKQMQSALQAQQTGASAAGALGSLAGNELKGALELAQAEMSAPYSGSINAANILAKLQQPTKQVSSKELGALNQLGALGSLVTGGAKGLFGYTGLDKEGKAVQVPGLLDTVFGSGAAKKFQEYIKKPFSGGTSGGGTSGGGTYDPNYDFGYGDDTGYDPNYDFGYGDDTGYDPNYDFGYGDEDFYYDFGYGDETP